MKKTILALALVASTFGAFAQQNVKKETVSAKTEVQKKGEGVKKHRKSHALKGESKTSAVVQTATAKKEVK
ncbi:MULTISPECIES: hypothetical protein [Olivibacter]|jgi:hypothetical protein|uniref:Uncharacterized protein n=2 Tax=Olivibacter TaxID=376469 RepID=A0ABV6HEP1_9SPHI|nr:MULTISPECIES: hypothetical protein [Olivibacter]MCL4637512.1 hypothetical protein [Olivibacter sp. UJ_SKK_5.1]MDM8177913.1 hypothetical protein [Olivibacter sp. 47]MDX3916182.1 hypothetical protein [Pseudosphingobacterium sp.]QEK99598.1 hypothetical protein FKG96_01885 [Olivibacter sp. LS-1]